MRHERELGSDKEREMYQAALDKLTSEEVDKFIEEGEMPASILQIVDIDPTSNNFLSKNYSDVVLGCITDIVEKEYDSFFKEIAD